MTYNHDNQELENCLTKAISEFKVRDMLTKFGIPEDAEITLELKLDENSKPIASCPVPTVIKRDAIPCESMSLTDLQKSLIAGFINPAIEKFDLSRRIVNVEESTEDSENKLLICLRTKNSNFVLDLIFISCCCRPCGPGCCLEFCIC